MRHYKDGLQALVSACLLYRPVLWTSSAAIHRLVERLGWLLPLAVLAGLAAAGGHAGLRWMRAPQPGRGGPAGAIVGCSSPRPRV